MIATDTVVAQYDANDLIESKNRTAGCSRLRTSNRFLGTH